MSVPASVCELLDSLADEVEGTEERADGTAREYVRDGVVFAACDGATGTAEFRLRPEIAAAALRTPGTAPSARGAEWVTLRPSMLDQFTHDRARAWFETGWRVAGE